jgi:hypothetical protein
MTRRLQFDFSDVSTDNLALSWVEKDPRVAYVRCPVSRLVFDQNRSPHVDLEDTRQRLDQYYHQMNLLTQGKPASFAGLDTVRPVTFANLPVLMEPESDEDWAHLTQTLHRVAKNSSIAYAKARDALIETVFQARYPEAGQPNARLDIQGLHDTMNLTARPDGAVANERASADRLPNIVSLSNRGDDRGEQRPSGDGPIATENLTTMPADALRGWQDAYRAVLDAGEADVCLNRPYLGGYELQYLGRMCRLMNARSQGRLTCHVHQAEYLREWLMGEENSRHLQQPGTDWIDEDAGHIERITDLLSAVLDRVHPPAVA